MSDAAGGTSQGRARLDSAWLIARAHDWGYPEVGVRTLQTFRSQGLLPRPTTVDHDGQKPINVYPEIAERQLASVLYWQKFNRNHDVLRVALWLDGYPVDLDLVRESIESRLVDLQLSADRVMAKLAPVAELADKLGALETLARRVVRQRRYPIPMNSEARLADRVTAVKSLANMFLLGGEPLEDTEEHGQLIERAIGLTPSARTRRIPGYGPWLTGPATDLFAMARMLSLPALVEVSRTATEDELIQARTAAVAIFRYLPVMARAAAAVFGGSNPVGIRAVGLFDQQPQFAPWLVTIMIAANRNGLQDNLDQIVAPLTEVPARIAEARQLRRLSPQQIAENIARQPKRDRARIKRVVKAVQDGSLLPAGPMSPALLPKQSSQ